jgi:hypothetical protein
MEDNRLQIKDYKSQFPAVATTGKGGGGLGFQHYFAGTP